ncbi:MAG TPA: terminase [Actinophytocola sp.]|uniref:terminase n=1 Tax=Actinophytocola sp. TaxID=1872138 RepID=UPI002DDCA58C|nr:terminase [Actinophytocola sp.]HEV2784688.1 terminase [Actinophytocola sp.]
MLGSTEPRLWTPPLRELTPATSYGFAACDFACDVVERPFDPWQEWLVIHAGELLPDGRPRFRIVLVLVARQNGKTEVLVVLSLYWLFVEFRKLILGTSTNLDYAKESWEKALALAEETDDLADEIAPRGIRRTNGEQTLTTVDRCRYKIAASNRRGGRSLTVHRLIGDELREHHDWSAYNAAVPAMNAVPDAQAFLISNQGDERSVVLKSLRKAALTYIETGKGDPRLGLFEWSAPDGSDPTDLRALAAANPNLRRRIDPDNLLGAAHRAKEAGGEELAGFKTEVMCMDVPMLDPAIDPEAWTECLDTGDLTGLRPGVALCVDLALDGQHATLAAAAQLPDGRVRIEVVAAWSGPGCTRELRRDLPGHLARVRPRKLGWFPAGPAAAVAADLADRKKRGAGVAWPPAGVAIEEIRQETTAVCMGFAEQVTARQIAHSDDPLFNAHALAAEKLHQGDAWRFTRRGAGHVDATYAAAGATHLARTLPPPPPKPRLITSKRHRSD